ncbi:MAG: tetratricopeptide repeat protein [Candidatus Levybacteria bacterium]|nr:tetratricopeptide repeat protein [Candidatus Levybacteria bacterium]
MNLLHQIQTLNSQAFTLKQNGQIDKAEQTLKIALRLAPNHPLTNYNLGTLLKNQGKPDEALALLKKAADFTHDSTAPLNNLALCLNQLGLVDEAIQTYKRALKIEPTNPLLNYNIANLYLENNMQQKAIVFYKKSIEYEPKNPLAYANLGISYFQLSDKKAILPFKKAIELSPQTTQYYYTLAYIYEKAGDTKNAIKYYEKTIQMEPNFEYALAHLFTQKRKICDWTGLESISQLLDQTHKESPWSSIMRTEDLKSNLIAAKGYSQELEGKISKNLFSFKKGGGRQKIRLGYISAHFGNHPITFTTASVIKNHDRSKFEVFVYSYGPNDKSTYRKNIENAASQFIDVTKLTDKEAAKKIFDDQIDILVDLSGYTQGNRAEILAMRPSPLQITWAGLCATTGSDFIDYFIADSVIVPKKDAQFYSEKMIYLPPCFCPIQDIIPLSRKKLTKKHFGLPENTFIFASFNQMYKIDKTIWETWMEVLKKVPQSVLWVFIQNNEGKNNLKRHAQNQGINPNRIIFTNQLSLEEFYSSISLADLALDTLVYGGGTTSYHSLLKKVPLITLRGKHPASLFSTSILKELGLEELSTKNIQEYKNIAISLATDNDKLMMIKHHLTPEKFDKTILNIGQKVSHLEDAYQQIWHNYLLGNKPKQVEVS